MSIRNAFSTVKNFVTNLLSPENREEEGGQPSQRGLFGRSNARKRVNVFEPEITDDEDDFPGIPAYQSYQPFSKRPRVESEYEMSRRRSYQPQHKYVTRGSGIPPDIEGVTVQPWEFNFKSSKSKSRNQQEPPDLCAAGPSTSKSAMVSALDLLKTRPVETEGGIGKQSKHTLAMNAIKDRVYGRPSTSTSEKDIEVITLDDDVGPSSLSRENTENRVQTKMKGASLSEKALRRPRITSPMKQTKNRDGNRFSNCWASLGKRLAGASSVIRPQEKQQYKRLLKAYGVMTNNGMPARALSKTKLDESESAVLYNRFGPSPTSGVVSLWPRKDQGSFNTALSCKPTTALLPRLYSTPFGTDTDYLGLGTSKSGLQKRLAIQAPPETVDLTAELPTSGKELSPITPTSSRRSQIYTPFSVSANFSNLEDALNSSGVLLEDEAGTSQLAIEDAALGSVDPVDSEKAEVEDKDVNIIEERVVKTSRNRSINTLALEQTSCRYVEKQWLEDSKSSWRDNQKHREDRIREETETISLLLQESTIDKERKEKIRKKLTLTEIIVLEEPPQEIPELTDEILAVIRHAKARGNDNEVLAQVRLLKDTITISRGDVKTLGASQWLNDNVINTYMGLIVLRSKMDKYPSVYAFTTFFYPKLLKEGYSNSLKRWTRKDDIFAHDLLIFPIHLGLHWCLACIDLRKKTIRYFDSLGGDNNKCLHSLLDYISREMKERKQMDLNKSEWTLENVKGIPHQQNGSDCGMFACKFAEYLSRDAAITFTQEHMPYYRDRMIYELIKEDLMHP